MIYLKTLVSAGRKTAFTLGLLLPSLLLSACHSTPDAQRPKSAQATPTPKPSPEAHVFVDEAMLAKPYAIIGGAVQNVGNEKLEKLSIEIELRRRDDSGVETREIKVEPGDLEPGQKGKFSLRVLSEEWSGSRVIGLKSGARAEGEVAFKSLPGAKRPPEKIKENVIIVKTPKKKSSGDDFINTPDTPYSVP